MEDVYSFLENRIRENFEVEALLKSSLRGKVTKLRHRDSHRRYVCRSYYQPSDIYLRLLDKECSSLPRIYEALERCYRELEDYKQAYLYASKRLNALE